MEYGTSTLESVVNMYKKSFVSIWGGAIAGILFFNLFNQNEFLRELTDGSNLIQFAVACFSFLVVSLFLNMLLKSRIFDKDSFIDIICAIACISVAIFMCICWKQDSEVNYSPTGSYLWHMYPSWLVFVILATLAFLYKVTIEDVYFDRGGAKTQFGLLVYYIMVIFLGGYLNYFLEYLNVDSFHGGAVFNSVYNVLHGVPYGEISNSVYGNYAVLLILPMKIMGNGEYFDLSRIMCLLSMMCIAFGIYVVHNLIEKKSTRVLCVAALLWVDIFRKSNYWQLYPLRVLCPMMFIAWLVFLTKKADDTGSSYKYVPNIITYLLLVFSIVWNKESGFVCLVGYLVFLVFKEMTALIISKDFKSIWRFILECLIMVSTVFTAFCVVGLYNYFVSDKWITWKVFLFPLFADFIDVLEIGLQKGIWPWMAVAFLFLGTIVTLTLKIFLKGERSSKEYIYVAVATMGLGLMPYFINRAAWGNLTICYYEAIICIGGICQYMKDSDYGRTVATFMRTLSLMVLIAMVVGETLQLGDSLFIRKNMNLSQKGILELRDEIREDVEADTYAFGFNIPELYSILGWETRSYTTDWASLTFTNIGTLQKQKLYSDLESEDAIITDKQILSKDEDIAKYVDNLFYIDKSYEYNESVVFYLMRRK